MKKLLPLGAFLLVLSGCGSSKEEDPAPLVGTWTIRTLRTQTGNQAEHFTYPDHYQRLTFAADGTFTSVFMDSTKYTGTYTLNGKGLTRRYVGAYDPVAETIQALSATTLVLVHQPPTLGTPITQTRTYTR